MQHNKYGVELNLAANNSYIYIHTHIQKAQYNQTGAESEVYKEGI